MDSIRGSEIILISDGLDNHGGLEYATQELFDEGVVVHSISVTEAADERLVNISAQTGGRILYDSELGSFSLPAMFLELVSGGATIDALAVVTVS